MLNIISGEKELLVLKDFINISFNDGLTKSNIEELLKELLPSKNGELLINYKVNEMGINIADFVASNRRINISLNKVNEWLDKNTKDFLQNLKTCDSKTLRTYLFLFMLTHEIEHSYQYLIGEGLAETPNDVLKSAYKGIYDLFISKDYIIPRPVSEMRRFISIFLYRLKQNYYLLERNASIESMDLVGKCALYNGREDIFKLFNEMRSTYSMCGYINSCMGSIEETYKNILMYDKYKRFYSDVDLSEEDKIRFGFCINEETRRKVLSRK